MSSRKARMTRKANALFEHNPNYTFRQLMESYRFWKRFTKKCKHKNINDVENNDIWIDDKEVLDDFKKSIEL